VTSAMSSPLPADNDWPQLNSRGFTRNPVLSTGMRTRMGTKPMWITRKKHRKLMMDQRRMWKTEGIVGLTWEPVMSMDMRARMAMMRMHMRRKKHRQPMMHQHRMGRSEGIVLENVKIRQYISDQ